MSFITHRFTRLILPGLAIAASLASATSTLPASAATARSGVTGKCDTAPVFFGLHSMGEGPSNVPGPGQVHTISPELESFDTDQNAISGAVLTYPVSYLTVQPQQWSKLLAAAVTTAATAAALIQGEHDLNSDINSYTKACLPGSHSLRVPIMLSVPLTWCSAARRADNSATAVGLACFT